MILNSVDPDGHADTRRKGLDATRQIRELAGCRKTSILAMTADAFAEDKAHWFDAGMDDFIVKPIEPLLILSCLLKLLDRGSA